jgi:hypothetical protein
VRYLRVRRSIEWGALSEQQTDRWGRSCAAAAAAPRTAGAAAGRGSGPQQRGQLERQRAAAARTAGAAAGSRNEDSWSGSRPQQRGQLEQQRAAAASVDIWSGPQQRGQLERQRHERRSLGGWAFGDSMGGKGLFRERGFIGGRGYGSNRWGRAARHRSWGPPSGRTPLGSYFSRPAALGGG